MPENLYHMQIIEGDVKDDNIRVRILYPLARTGKQPSHRLSRDDFTLIKHTEPDRQGIFQYNYPVFIEILKQKTGRTSNRKTAEKIAEEVLKEDKTERDDSRDEPPSTYGVAN